MSKLKLIFAAALLALSSTTAFAQLTYQIYSNNTSTPKKVSVTKNGEPFSTYTDVDVTISDEGQTIINNIMNAIRNNANGNDVTINFTGSTSNRLDLSSLYLNFENGLSSNWGLVTLTGSITSIRTGGGAIRIGSNVSVISKATIANTSSGSMNLTSAIYKTGAGTVTIDAGTISITANATVVSMCILSAIYNSGEGKIIINNGTITAGSSTEAEAICNQGTGTIEINGGLVRALGSRSAIYNRVGIIEINGGTISSKRLNYGTIYNNGTLSITGSPTISNTSESENAIYAIYNHENAQISIGGNPTINSKIRAFAETITATDLESNEIYTLDITPSTPVAVAVYGGLLDNFSLVTANYALKQLDNDIVIVSEDIHTATVNILKDGEPWSSHGKTFALKLYGESIDLTGTDELTANVVSGTWKIYQSETYTGVDVEIDGDEGQASVKYHTVSFKDDNGEELGSDIVLSGSDATAPTLPTRTGYTVAWDKVFSSITEPTTVTAVYTKTADLIAAETFQTNHSAILGKDVASIKTTDKAAVQAALDAHNALSAEAKAFLTTEETKLNALLAKISDLEAAPIITNRTTLNNIPAGTKIEVYNLRGELVHVSHSGNSEILGILGILVQTKGIYIVKAGNKTQKVVVK